MFNPHENIEGTCQGKTTALATCYNYTLGLNSFSDTDSQVQARSIAGYTQQVDDGSFIGGEAQKHEIIQSQDMVDDYSAGSRSCRKDLKPSLEIFEPKSKMKCKTTVLPT